VPARALRSGGGGAACADQRPAAVGGMRGLGLSPPRCADGSGLLRSASASWKATASRPRRSVTSPIVTSSFSRAASQRGSAEGGNAPAAARGANGATVARAIRAQSRDD
jgi:hypothetical protein